MKNFVTVLVVIIVIVGAYVVLTDESADDPMDETATTTEAMDETATAGDVSVNPISHATAVLEWNNSVIYLDPVGGGEAFTGSPTPDIVLVTDIHGDHLSVETLNAVIGEETVIVAPQAVVDELPAELASQTTVLANGETTNQAGFSIEATPMYNLPQSEDSYHVKGRGNGYLLETSDTRVYIAGDTEDTPEMRALENIDIAFVPMNLPYTMDVEAAASGVLAFAPDQVYPYHFRGQDGFSDVEQFRQLVNEGNPDIEVVLADWYPETEDDGV